MSKAFVKDDAGTDDDDDGALPELPAGVRNYITPVGYTRLRNELAHLVKTERPEVVRVVATRDYLVGRRGDRVGDALVDEPERPVDPGRSTLDLRDRMDQRQGHEVARREVM